MTRRYLSVIHNATPDSGGSRVRTRFKTMPNFRIPLKTDSRFRSVPRIVRGVQKTASIVTWLNALLEHFRVHLLHHYGFVVEAIITLLTMIRFNIGWKHKMTGSMRPMDVAFEHKIYRAKN